MRICPYCKSLDKQVKSGLNLSGSQRYLCRLCDRVYTPKPNRNGYSPEMRLSAINMYKEGLSYRAIGKRLDVGTQSVANWVHSDKKS